MSELEDKFGSILNDPKMMQQIMSMAQALGQSAQPQKEEPTPTPAPAPPAAPSLPEIDPNMLRQLSGLAGQSTIDREQRALLSALGPYLSRERVSKLEKAMRAAKMARLASSFLGQGGLSILTGR